MKRTTYQHPELRDANDNIIQDGTFGKHSAFSNATNDGAFDYILNNLEALHDNINGARIYVANKAALPATGDLSAMYIAEDTGKWYLWDGTKYIETDNARKIADEAIAARDAAKASQAAAKTSEQNAKASESNAAASKQAAATSAGAAKTSEQNAGAQANTAKAWATSTTSPDGVADTASSTGKTQSARSWALYSKDRATASASSASAAAGSAGAAKTSETKAATSATNAANSAKAAAGSATAAASSASSASTSATNAKAAMNTANTAAASSKTAASSASTSATSASTSASNASKSEIAAKTAQTAAEKARDDANTAVNKLTGAMKYAGQVDNYSDLESYTKSKGDIWNIVNADPAHGIKAGDNVAWNGTDWDNLSGTVDLSIYAEKADYQKVITSATANGATITFNYKDGTTSTATVNNVASATAATNDAKGQRIDSTYEKVADASNVHTSLQNSINSLSTSKQDKLTFDLTPTADSSNPVTSSGIKTALDGKPSNTGAGASGTWPISVSGNASTATKATNDGNGNPIASTYLPLSGGTLTGVVNGVTPTAGDNSTKIATTAFVNAKAGNYLPLTGGSITGDVDITGDLSVSGAITGNVTGTADKAVADGSGNNIVNTYVTKSALASSVTTATGKVTTLTATDSTLTNATITGTTSVPTANAGNSSKAIANTEFVQGELTNYLPLSGGTLTGVVNGVTPPNGDNSTKLATTAFVNAKAGGGTPTGVVQAFAGSTTPQGWLLCDGSAVSRTDYAALYAVIGTTYGSGNGSTTFNLPNLTDKFVEGSATAGTEKSAGLPNITGNVSGLETKGWHVAGDGAFSVTPGTMFCEGSGNAGGLGNINLDASRSSSIYGNSTTVQPPAVTMRYIIKY